MSTLVCKLDALIDVLARDDFFAAVRVLEGALTAAFVFGAAFVVLAAVFAFTGVFAFFVVFALTGALALTEAALLAVFRAAFLAG